MQDENTPPASSDLGRWPLHGWDDGKVYFWTAERGVGDLCVNDEPELMEELVRICWDYYRRRGIVGGDAGTRG